MKIFSTRAIQNEKKELVIMGDFLKKITEKNSQTNNKRKIENLCFFIIILVITLFLIKNIWGRK